MNPGFQQIANEIAVGSLDRDLDRIVEQIRIRRRQIDSNKMGVIRVGDSVQLKAKMRPTYLAGSIARVTKVMCSYVTIDLLVPITGPQGKLWYRNIRCPISIIEGIISAKEGA